MLVWGKSFGVFLVSCFGSPALSASAKGGDDARILTLWSSLGAPGAAQPRLPVAQIHVGATWSRNQGSGTPGKWPGARGSL